MTDQFAEFRDFRTILCICPHCGALKRVSDLHLRAKGPAVKTWLDNYDNAFSKIQSKEQRFEEKEKEMREKAVEQGRDDAKKAVNALLCPSFRKLGLNPFDIKPVLNPVDFIVFKGMTDDKGIEEVLFLSKACNNESLNAVRKQVNHAITRKLYGWETARVDNQGNVELEDVKKDQKRENTD